jgi:hypothetical protein
MTTQKEADMYIRSIAVLILGAGLAAGAVIAGDGSIHGLQDKPQFVAMKVQVNKDLADGDRYKEIKPEDQKTLLATLTKMDERWQHADDLAHLSPDDRIAMANDQEVVAGIITHASADSRVICERVEPIGSHLPQNICKTVAQRRREQEQAQDAARAGSLESKH